MLLQFPKEILNVLFVLLRHFYGAKALAKQPVESNVPWQKSYRRNQ